MHAGSASSAHNSAVVSVACEACNQYALSLAQDGCVQKWEFKTCKEIGSLEIGCPALKMCLHPHSQLAAVCCQDFSVQLIDSQQMAVVRPRL
jgi:WD40 repeat protein